LSRVLRHEVGHTLVHGTLLAMMKSADVSSSTSCLPAPYDQCNCLRQLVAAWNFSVFLYEQADVERVSNFAATKLRGMWAGGGNRSLSTFGLFNALFQVPHLDFIFTRDPRWASTFLLPWIGKVKTSPQTRISEVRRSLHFAGDRHYFWDRFDSESVPYQNTRSGLPRISAAKTNWRPINASLDIACPLPPIKVFDQADDWKVLRPVPYLELWSRPKLPLSSSRAYCRPQVAQHELVRRLSEHAASPAKFFLTFRGEVSSHPIRYRLRSLRGPGVAIQLTCKTEQICKEMHGHSTPDMQRGALNSSSVYADLMNSSFVLVPPGAQPASYRLLEVMSAGAIPVFLESTKPFADVVAWDDCSVTIPADQMEHAVQLLRAFSLHQITEMRLSVLRTYYTQLDVTRGLYAETFFLSLLRQWRARRGWL
jgi:hypothetical protein